MGYLFSQMRSYSRRPLFLQHISRECFRAPINYRVSGCKVVCSPSTWSTGLESRTPAFFQTFTLTFFSRRLETPGCAESPVKPLWRKLQLGFCSRLRESHGIGVAPICRMSQSLTTTWALSIAVSWNLQRWTVRFCGGAGDTHTRSGIRGL